MQAALTIGKTHQETGMAHSCEGPRQEDGIVGDGVHQEYYRTKDISDQHEPHIILGRRPSCATIRRVLPFKEPAH